MNASPTSTPDPASSRVLIVDDVARNLQVVGTLLRNEGYEVMPATSGTQALERVQAEPPDLILLDLMMPEMDGLEVCRRLKADRATSQIPVIYLTASNEMEHLVRGFEVGAVDYVTKPFNAPELLARVRTHLELQHVRQRLREMNDEKNEFMGVAAHDLRSPLTSVLGFADLVLSEPNLSSEGADCVGRIRDSAKHMLEMVQNLLDVNAIERGQLKPKLSSCDLADLVQNVVGGFRPHAEAKQQRIEFDRKGDRRLVLADPTLTAQVLENLISNAVKYSPSDKTIRVGLTATEDAVRCEVRDEGPGLSEADQRRLFEKFARLSARPTGGEPSVGLGLSIVKKMVESMRGRVFCESELGKGATFIVELPSVHEESSPAQ